MNWQAPRYEEIKMDAEIGSYQADDDARFYRGAHAVGPSHLSELGSAAAEPSTQAAH